MSEPEEVEFARVDSVDFGIEDHGILGINITFQLSSNSFQGTGYYSLEGPHGTAFIKRLLTTFSASKLEDLVGRTVRVHRYSAYGRIEGLSQPPWEGDKFFYIAGFWDEIKRAEAAEEEKT